MRQTLPELKQRAMTAAKEYHDDIRMLRPLDVVLNSDVLPLQIELEYEETFAFY